MVITADAAAAVDAIEPSPSISSLRGLDAVNLYLAEALSGFGPYVAVFLAEEKWTQQSISSVLTAARFAGLLSLGLVGHAALGERPGRNQRIASTGGVFAADLMGLVANFLSYRAIFFVAPHFPGSGLLS